MPFQCWNSVALVEMPVAEGMYFQYWDSAVREVILGKVPIAESRYLEC